MKKKALVFAGSGQDSAWTLGSDETVTEVEQIPDATAVLK